VWSQSRFGFSPDGGFNVRDDLNSLFEELSRAARSFRVLADYLEAHPDALIRGKAGANSP
jgi:paraquat-inducible protein B